MARRTEQTKDALNKALKSNMAKRKAQAKALAVRDMPLEDPIEGKE